MHIKIINNNNNNNVVYSMKVKKTRRILPTLPNG